MNTPSPCLHNRRALVLGSVGILLSAAAPVRQRIVTMLGDSITAGYGLPGRDALPVQLETTLKASGLAVRVRGAGVSGDTSRDGLARVDFSVQPDTEVCIVALGGNDLLQGVDPAVTARSLTAIVGRLKSRKITVILAGMRAPEMVGASYARQYNALFPEIARTRQVILYPDLLAGVAGIRSLNQKDGIHPTAQGARLIAARLAPVVVKALRSRG
jgi:acyl-CoA thioesterase-1